MDQHSSASKISDDCTTSASAGDLREVCSTDFFFEKIEGALLCHLRRKQLYITRRSEHHHHTNNAHNKMLHRHNAHNLPAHIAKQPVTEYMHVCLLASTFWPLQCRIAICDEHHWLPLSMGGNVHCSRFILRSTFQKKKDSSSDPQLVYRSHLQSQALVSSFSPLAHSCPFQIVSFSQNWFQNKSIIYCKESKLNEISSLFLS